MEEGQRKVKEEEHAIQSMDMKWTLVLGIVVLCILLAAGCEEKIVLPEEDLLQDGPDPGSEEQAQECTVAADCMRAGCSGTVCQTKDVEPMITTCEWREEYACFRDIECGCIQGRCAWQTAPAFDACIEEKRQAG